MSKSWSQTVARTKPGHTKSAEQASNTQAQVELKATANKFRMHGIIASQRPQIAQKSFLRRALLRAVSRYGAWNITVRKAGWTLQLA